MFKILSTKVKDIINRNQKTIIFLLIFGIYMLLIDFINNSIVMQKIDFRDYIERTLVAFDILWYIFFVLIIINLKKTGRKIFLATFVSLTFIITIVNYFKYNFLKSIFSWKDLVLTKNAFKFIDSVYKFLNFKFVLILILLFSIIFILFKLSNNNINNISSKKIINIILPMILLLYLPVCLYMKKHNESAWYKMYLKWVNSTSLIRTGGFYDYMARDFYYSFFYKYDIVKAQNQISKLSKSYYISKNLSTTNYKGIFKNKNLIYVMMESMDDWMVNKETTPTIYKMMNEGINFSNYYSPIYVTGSTGNTEFIANTGIYPNIEEGLPHYAYLNNKFNYSLPNLFKDEDYRVNSFHKSQGDIYNRGVFHINLGYTTYNSYDNMNIPNKEKDYDTSLIKYGYKKITSNKKFMSSIITFTPHAPYTYNNGRCKKNLKQIKELYPNLKDEEKLCAYSAARETDNMFNLLIKSLEKDNILDDTVIVAFTDHPNNVIIKKDETELLNKTTCFIWNNSIEHKDIDNITSTINLVPTLINMFDLNSNFSYVGYDALNNNNGYLLFNDLQMYNSKGLHKADKNKLSYFDYSKYILDSNYSMEEVNE